MKKSIGSVLAAIGLMVGLMLIVLKKGMLGAGLILVTLCLLLLVTTFVSELLKLYGKNVQSRDRHS
jgi:hypothetical protein